MCSECSWDEAESGDQPISEEELKDISTRAGREIDNEEEAYEFLKQEREDKMREHQFDPTQEKRDLSKLGRRRGDRR
jgi:hypothetical protein